MQVQVPARAEEACQICEPTTKTDHHSGTPVADTVYREKKIFLFPGNNAFSV
jgi:hypothetical protein